MMPLSIVPLKLLLQNVPDRVHAWLLSKLLNRLIAGQDIERRLADLEGKRFCLLILDTGNCWQFCIRNAQLRYDPQESLPDVRIEGNLKEFLLLATRSEDADTLFFARRLCLQGNTETGLHIKNILDEFEFNLQVHVQSLLGQTAAKKIFAIAPISKMAARIQSIGEQVLDIS